MLFKKNVYKVIIVLFGIIFLNGPVMSQTYLSQVSQIEQPPLAQETTISTEVPPAIQQEIIISTVTLEEIIASTTPSQISPAEQPAVPQQIITSTEVPPAIQQEIIISTVTLEEIIISTPIQEQLPLPILGPTRKKISERGKIIIGLEAGYPPFEFKDKSKKLVGFDIDIAKELTKQMNVEVEFKEYAWEKLIGGLKNEEIDIIISGMTKIPERQLEIDFTDSYFKTGQVVIINKKLFGKVKNLQYLNKPKFKIGAQKATTSEKAVKDTFPLAKIILYDNVDVCIVNLIQNKINAFLYDRPLAEIILKTFSEDISILLGLGELTKEDYCFAINKGNQDFIDYLNNFITNLRQTGEYDRIYKVWFTEKKW